MCSYSVQILIFIFLVNFYLIHTRDVSPLDWQSDEAEREYEVIPPSKLIWSCNFEGQDCGIINDGVVGHFFKHSKSQINGFAKRNMLLLNITQIKTHPSGARLITPYFKSPNYHFKGCLTMEYLIGGNGIRNLLVYQQEVENRCLYSAVFGQTIMKASKDWQKLSLTVDLQHGSPRYFIEVHFDNRPPNKGFVALSEMKFLDSGCNNNDANHCLQPMGDEPEDSTDYHNDLP